MAVISEILPGSSSSSSTHHHDHIYDIFLSFRGVDTRKRFTAHLYKALREADLNTFLDDEEIETGEPLKPELESAIKSSRASIIVLSENYAFSTWCLDELVLILEQKSTFNQIIIPVFYDVEPTNVRNQQSSFGIAMEKHTQRMEEETDAEKRSEWGQKIELWKRALTQVADLKGEDAKDRLETKLIEDIVNKIYTRLGVPLGTTTLPQLVGMEYHIESITSWLKDTSSHTGDVLTIWGMGGIGKTSLADYVYKLHCHKYRSSFIRDINRRCAETYLGLLDVQKQLCDDILKTSSIQVHDVSVYTSRIENALAHKKVLLVLDDVNSLDQLDALLGNKGIHSGCKIIITTRVTSLVQRCALFKIKAKPLHKECTLKGLSMDASLELLCHHAFTSNYPNEGYEEVSKKLASYCEGHPLALKVLGESLNNRVLSEWEDSVELLKKEPHSHIKIVLQMSFDSLPFQNDKELFKHIACFFVGIDRGLSETILNACDINTRLGIKNLTDRCLLSIGWNNKLIMHQLVQEMGRDLVRQESLKKPWKRSRLWCSEESFKVLKQKKGKVNLLGLALDMRMLDKKKLRGSFELKTYSLSTMDNLMLLQLNYVQLNGCFENFPEELRWLCMHGSPLKSIPLDLPMENLVVLDMSYSNIESFDMSNDKRLLRSLKILDLSFCEQLLRLGGFSELPALEMLIVRNCITLIEVCESVEQCVELVLVDLSYCYVLQRVPISIGKLPKIKTLLLDGCSSGESQIETIPRDLKFFTISFPSSLIRLSLANNNLCNESFPIDFSCLSMIRELSLDGNPIVSMPNCVRTLPRLEKLSMGNCKMLISIEHPPCTLRELSIFFTDHSKLHYTSSPRKIKFNPEMSPLNLYVEWELLSDSSIEIDGKVKIQAMAGVKENVLHSLGWMNLDLIKEMRLRTSTFGSELIECQTQMYYEFGIFSTIYGGKEMPDWIQCRSKGSSISFTVPYSPNNLRGLNFCCVETIDFWYDSDFDLPIIKVTNITKDHTWIYSHYISEVLVVEKCLILLSHWMFGPNEMKGGDHITIEVGLIFPCEDEEQLTMECGISVVYDEDGMIEEHDEDVLDYYKSWNHIIGGDLSAFQLTTGEYILDNNEFWRCPFETDHSPYRIGDLANFKEPHVRFKAFSQKKSDCNITRL
ncbi:hypothetical protein SSX86_023166 [Deinandra increscens subsp. villosa]|uniref:TIR domain-containing protein n=1 Tax=Deinandra increscens subsp. villosa TaxID=3103831 RepID=A0AAP0CQ67_9ASTR